MLSLATYAGFAAAGVAYADDLRYVVPGERLRHESGELFDGDGKLGEGVWMRPACGKKKGKPVRQRDESAVERSVVCRVEQGRRARAVGQRRSTFGRIRANECRGSRRRVSASVGCLSACRLRPARRRGVTAFSASGRSGSEQRAASAAER